MPFSAPSSAPAITAAPTAAAIAHATCPPSIACREPSTAGSPPNAWSTSTATMLHVTVVEATDRSKPPAIITNVIPHAMMPINAALTSRFSTRL